MWIQYCKLNQDTAFLRPAFLGKETRKVLPFCQEIYKLLMRKHATVLSEGSNPVHPNADFHTFKSNTSRNSRTIAFNIIFLQCRCPYFFSPDFHHKIVKNFYIYYFGIIVFNSSTRSLLFESLISFSPALFWRLPNLLPQLKSLLFSANYTALPD